jgi:dolichol-phosphate mannosyltransferase
MKPFSTSTDSIRSTESIKCAIVIPSYKEFLALPHLLEQLSPELTSSDAVIICDDTKESEKYLIIEACQQALQNSKCCLIFSMAATKSGRGGAVRRGMQLARSKYENIEMIIECDADGSHRPIDIMKLKNHPRQTDLLIGSRYLPTSRIVGWPTSRRLFSWLLNKTIPKFLEIPLTDITNGLRRYSLPAIQAVLAAPAQNKGFIYLSEQAILITDKNLTIDEIPTEFINRQEGKSTVGWKEVFGALIGIFKLLIKRKSSVAN